MTQVLTDAKAVFKIDGQEIEVNGPEIKVERLPYLKIAVPESVSIDVSCDVRVSSAGKRWIEAVRQAYFDKRRRRRKARFRRKRRLRK